MNPYKANTLIILYYIENLAANGKTLMAQS